MSSRLFGSSGVRGVVNLDLTPELAEKIGVTTVMFSHARRVLVARDTRLSGEMLENALSSGLLAAGADAISIGIVPTPNLAYSIKPLGADAGIMITASHNPPQYNGLKIFDRNGLAYGEQKQEQIEAIVRKGEYIYADWPKIGHMRRLSDDVSYSEAVKESVDLAKDWSAIVDPGGGATCELAPRILRRMNCKVFAVNADADGSFASRSSEPNAETLVSLARIVKEIGADLALAYDGDGDRVAFIDENGHFADFDRILASYCAYMTKRNKGGVVVTNVEASMSVEKMVESQGGKVVRTKVGDVYVSEAMKQNAAIFGGEPCGAWIHPEFLMCPDGICSSVKLLKALEDEEQTLSEFVAEAPAYQTRRENVPCPNGLKSKLIAKSAQELRTAFPEVKTISNVDGVRLTLPMGWILLRASGTEALLRLTAEGESSKATNMIMEKALDAVRDLVKSVQK